MHDLMNVKMSRLEFMKFLGLGFLSMLGFGHLTHFIASLFTKRHSVASHTDSRRGFGSGRFGA